MMIPPQGVVAILVLYHSFVAAIRYDDITNLNASCYWNVDILKLTEKPSLSLIKVNSLNSKESRVKIENFLTEEARKEIRDLGTAYAFRYMLALEVYCDKVYSPESSLLVAEQSVSLIVTVKSSVQDRHGVHTGIEENSMQAALTDHQELFPSDYDSSGCTLTLCNPVWVVPLPFNDRNVHVNIKVKESPSILITAPLSKYVILNPFLDETENVQFTEKRTFTVSMIQNLLSQGVQALVSASKLAALDMLTIDSALMLTSDNQWLSSKVLDFAELKDEIPSLTSLCNSPRGTANFHISQAAVGGSVIFLATNYGLLELRLSGHQLIPRHLKSSCLQALRQPLHIYEDFNVAMGWFVENSQYMLIRTLLSKSRVNSLYQTETAEISLSFCRVTTCRVLDATFDGAISTIVSILTQDLTKNTKVYNIWQWTYERVWNSSISSFSEETDTVSALTHVKTIYGRMTKEPEHDLYIVQSNSSIALETLVQNLESELGFRTTVLCGDCDNTVLVTLSHIITHTLPSSGYVLYGSHIIYGSLTGEFYCISPPEQSKNFTQVLSDESGLFVAYSKDPKEIWAWVIQSWTMRRVFPSHGWSVIHDEFHDHHVTDIISKLPLLTMRFQLDHRLLLLLLNESAPVDQAIVKLAIDIPAIIRYEDVDSDYFPNIPYELHTETNDISDHRCDLKDVRFNVTSLNEYTQYKRRDWHIFPLARAYNQFIQDRNTVLIYQTLVYEQLHHTDGDVIRNPKEHFQTYYSVITNEYQISNQQDFNYGISKANFATSEFDNGHLPSEETTMTNHELPSVIYLDRGKSVSFYISMSALDRKNTSVAHSTGLEREHAVELSVELSDNKVLSIITNRVEYFAVEGSLFEITLSSKTKEEDFHFAVQDEAGKNMLHVTLLLRLSYAQLHCPRPSTEGTFMLDGLHHVNVMVGCPPRQRIFFDLDRSIEELTKVETDFHCLNRDTGLPCFYFQHTFYPYFGVENLVTGEKTPFTGNYTITVIGGGESISTKVSYTQQEIAMSSNLGLADNRKNLMIQPQNTTPIPFYKGFPIYNMANNKITWACNSLSKCASPSPRDWGVPKFVFHLRFSNREVDHSTQCLHELDFIVQVFGYKVGQQDYAVIIGTLVVLFMHTMAYYFWKTRYYWLARLHTNNNKAIKRLLSIKNLATAASQSSLKKSLLESIYQDDPLVIHNAIWRAEISGPSLRGSHMLERPFNFTKQTTSSNELNTKIAIVLEQYIATQDIAGLSSTIARMEAMHVEFPSEELKIKTRRLLLRKAHLVLKLIDAFGTKNYKELAEALKNYKETISSEELESSQLIKKAYEQLSAILTKQLLKSLKKKDTWEIHYAITEFRNHNIFDQYNLIPKAEHIIYYRLTAKLRKAIKQGTPQLLRDAVVDTERELEFHHIPDREGVVDEAKTLLYKILRDKLAEELKRRDSMKIRNAINRFAFYGVADASGFLEKANYNLYQLVIPPIAKNLTSDKTPDELHRLVTKIRLELNRFGLKDEEKIAAKAEKMMYDAIAKQLQAALKNHAPPRDLAIVLAAFIMSKKQYRITQDVRKLEDVGKHVLYKELIPFLLKAMELSGDNPLETLSAAITAARIEFSRIGIQDPGDIIEAAERKLYDFAFGPLKEATEFSRNSKELWIKIVQVYSHMKEHNVTDSNSLILKAEHKFSELINMEIEDAVISHDVRALQDIKYFLKSVSLSHKLELLQLADKSLRTVNTKLVVMNNKLESNEPEYRSLCDRLIVGTYQLKRNHDLQAIMPLVVQFEQSGFPDRDGCQKTALRAIAEIVDDQFKKNMAIGNYSKVALLSDVISSVAMEPRQKDVYYLLTVVCGKYLSTKTDMENVMAETSQQVKQNISSLESLLKNLRVLRQALPSDYLTGTLILESEMKNLLQKAEKLAIYLQNIEQLKSHLYDMNPADLVHFDKYRIVPVKLISILKAFLYILGRDPPVINTWSEVHVEISSYQAASDLLEEARYWKPPVSNSEYMYCILRSRDIVDRYIELARVTEESSAEEQTVSILIRWMLWAINDATAVFLNNGGKLDPLLQKLKAKKALGASVSRVLHIDNKSTITVVDKELTQDEMSVLKAIIGGHKDIIPPKASVLYLARFVRAAEGNQSRAITMLKESFDFKRSISTTELPMLYSAHEPLSKHCVIFEKTGTTKKRQPIYYLPLCLLDFDGLVKSCLPCQFVVHCLYHLERIEVANRERGVCNSVLLVDCTDFKQAATSSTLGEVASWLNILQNIMMRYYPHLFHTIYVIEKPKLRRQFAKFKIALFDVSPGMHVVNLDTKEMLTDFMDKESIPIHLGGNFDGAVPAHIRVPNVFHLSETESVKANRKHWLTLHLDTGEPKTLVFNQAQATPGALLYIEVETDTVINLEITYTSILVTTLSHVLSVDMVYSNVFDASQPGTYKVTLTSASPTSWLKKTVVRYEIGLANMPAQIREFAWKLEKDAEGHIIDLQGRGTSHHFLSPPAALD